MIRLWSCRIGAALVLGTGVSMLLPEPAEAYHERSCVYRGDQLRWYCYRRFGGVRRYFVCRGDHTHGYFCYRPMFP